MRRMENGIALDLIEPKGVYPRRNPTPFVNIFFPVTKLLPITDLEEFFQDASVYVLQKVQRPGVQSAEAHVKDFVSTK
jgi:hypothetical protein